MAQSKANSGLLKLSAELRNRIYEIVLTARVGDKNHSCEREGQITINPADNHYDPRVEFEVEDYEDEDDVNDVKRMPTQPAITKTSRQIREETLPIYYGENTFIAYPQKKMKTVFGARTITKKACYSLGGAEKWLQMIGPDNRALLKKVSFGNDWIPTYAPISPRRFTAILVKQGLALRNCVITVYHETPERRDCRERAQGDDNINPDDPARSTQLASADSVQPCSEDSDEEDSET